MKQISREGTINNMFFWSLNSEFNDQPIKIMYSLAKSLNYYFDSVMMISFA